MKVVNPQLLLQAAKYIQEGLLDVVGVYLFGSMAIGKANANSDIDFAVLAARPLPEFEVWSLAQSLAQDLGVDIDLIDLKRANSVMRMQIIAKGQRLLSINDEECEQFEDFVYSDFARLNEERAGILADIQRRGSVYG
ncbi:MAG: nucleotidyltransferase domain-containing protein [Mariprofundales bacterium]